MKRNILRTLICLVLVMVTLAAPITSAHASSLAHIVKINVSDARLREGAGDSAVIAKLKRGQKVLYWGEDKGSFCKVATIDGKVGYVYEDYLSAYGTVKKSMLYVTEERTSLYKNTSGSLKRNGSIGSEELVLVYSISGSWAKVRTTNGQSGYCKLSSLKDLF